MSKFFSLLIKFKKHKLITIKTKERKTRVMNNVVKLHDNYFDFYKNSYDKSPLDDEEARNPKQFKIIYQNG